MSIFLKTFFCVTLSHAGVHITILPYHTLQYCRGKKSATWPSHQIILLCMYSKLSVLSFSSDRLVTKTNTNCHQKFLLLFHCKKRRSQAVLFSFCYKNDDKKPVLDQKPKFYSRSRRFKTYGYGYGGRSLRPFLQPKVLSVVFLVFFFQNGGWNYKGATLD